MHKGRPCDVSGALGRCITLGLKQISALFVKGKEKSLTDQIFLLPPPPPTHQKSNGPPLKGLED